MGQDIRDRFTGAVEAFSRRNSPGHGLHGENSRHRSTDDTSKDVVSNWAFCTFYSWIFSILVYMILIACLPLIFLHSVILKGGALLEVAAPQRGLSWGALAPHHQLSPARTVLECFPAVAVVCLQHKGSNQVMSPELHLSVVLQPHGELGTKPWGVSSCCQLAQGRGNDWQVLPPDRKNLTN